MRHLIAAIWVILLLSGCLDKGELSDVDEKGLLIIKLQGDLARLEADNDMLRNNTIVLREQVESLRESNEKLSEDSYSEDELIQKIKDEITPKDRALLLTG